MATGDITSANSIVTLTVNDLFNAPVTLSDYSADRGFESEVRELAETQMSMDARMVAGWIPNPVNQTFSLMPDSDSFFLIEGLVQAQDVAMKIYRLGGVISLPSIGRKYTMLRGVLMSTNIIPNAARVLEARQFTIRWEKVFGVAI